MATDLRSRKPSTKSDDFLRRKFADLCARLERIDLIAHLLLLVLTVVGYAFLFGICDLFTGASSSIAIVAVRWIAYIVFLLIVGTLLVQTARCFSRRVNPYYVAHQLEDTLPDAKNSLINWLDFREEELPSAFRKNVGARAAEQWKKGDSARIVANRKLWVLGGVLAAPMIGVLTLFVLDPSGFLTSMRRAFLPFYAPAPVSRITITLLQPANGDHEVVVNQSVTFAAKIEGRLPAPNKPGAPTLHWRYQDNEDFLTQPLQEDAGQWWATLDPARLRNGFSYKISAGDAETQEYRISVRPRAHVRKFEVTYRHRPFRQMKKSTSIFPNEQSARPILHGPVGTEVELSIRTSRPVKSGRVEIMLGKTRKELPIDKLNETGLGFVSRFTLTQSGEFRVVFTAKDGEDNADREAYPIDVVLDELPKVVMNRPTKDMEIPAGASFILEGRASSTLGLRHLLVRMQGIDGPDKGREFEAIQAADVKNENGDWPSEIETMKLVALNELKDEKGGLVQLQAGSVLQYWLEAADGTDFPNPQGNVGKSAALKLKIIEAPVDPKQESIFRKNAMNQVNKHQQQQQEKNKKQPNKNKKDGKGESGGGGAGGGGGGAGKNPQDAMNQIQKQNAETEHKLNNALNNSQPDHGDSKGSDPKSGESKGGEGTTDAPDPRSKEPPPKASNDGGTSKGQSGAGSGETRDTGSPKQGDAPLQGNTKGAEQHGPERPTNEQQNAKNANGPPDLKSKGGMMPDPSSPPSAPKEGPGEGAKAASQPRGDGQKADAREPSFEDIAKNLDKLKEDGPDSEPAAKNLSDIAKNASDERKRELAREILQKNGRDAKDGKKNKSPIGTNGKSPGIGDNIKKEAANREFAARIGQMQLDDWQKRLTPELLKKAGITEAEWQRYVQNTQEYNAQVRALNSQIVRQAVQKMNAPGGKAGPTAIDVERTGTSTDPPSVNAPPPPEFRGAPERFGQAPK